MAGDGGWKTADDKIRLKENKSQTVFIEYRSEKVRRFIFSSITKHFYNTSRKGLSSKKKRVDFYYNECLQYRKHELSEKNRWKSQPIGSPPTLSWQQVWRAVCLLFAILGPGKINGDYQEWIDSDLWVAFSFWIILPKGELMNCVSPSSLGNLCKLCPNHSCHIFYYKVAIRSGYVQEKPLNM